MAYVYKDSPIPIGGEEWSDQTLKDLQAMPSEKHDCWLEIFKHSLILSGSPNAKWIKLATGMLDKLGRDTYSDRVLAWFPLVNKPRTGPINGYNLAPDYIHPHNVEILKGLACFASLVDNRDVARALTALALSAYKKLPGVGARALKLGNACLYSLGALPGMTGVDQLAILKVKVRGRNAINAVEKALNSVSVRLGMSASELEEIGIPSYGMEEVGVLREQMGEFTAKAHITGTHSMELHWEKPGGKSQKGIPSAVNEQYKEDVKEFKAAMKDIQKMLPAQRDRIDRLFISNRKWPYKAWKERYLDHPLMGYLSRRLIWTFSKKEDKGEAGIYWNGNIVDENDQPLGDLDDGTTVALWHPIDNDVKRILEWREWLEKHEVQQPFKQAHREVYILTDAERATSTYSNRYAAHIIKQHQFRSLADMKRWRSRLKMMYDDGGGEPAFIDLPEWKLFAEFWYDGMGEYNERDLFNDAGANLYLTTDQVRFYSEENKQDPIPLHQVPPLVFSEVMRDVDMFVSVASVANDPNWVDGGPGGRYRNYWTGYSFGDLSATAQTRKEVLERIIPRLKIRDRCSFTDKFLVVEGDLRTYKIHLGSGNILMAPNDQYLCIVPQQGGHQAEREGYQPSERLYIPFEGDNTLSIIISKALLLAEDTKITDTTIMSQIKRK